MCTPPPPPNKHIIQTARQKIPRTPLPATEKESVRWVLERGKPLKGPGSSAQLQGKMQRGDQNESCQQSQRAELEKSVWAAEMEAGAENTETHTHALTCTHTRGGGSISVSLSIHIGKLCVCGYGVCACVCGVCTHEHVKARGQPWLSLSITLHLTFFFLNAHLCSDGLRVSGTLVLWKHSSALYC